MCPQAIWENQFYYLFGFLFLVFIILVVSCSQISIVMVYFQLCAEVRRAGPGGGGGRTGSSIERVGEALWRGWVRALHVALASGSELLGQYIAVPLPASMYLTVPWG